MKLKIQVNPDSGAVYVAAIVEGEHRQTATLNRGQELEVLLEDTAVLNFGPVTGWGTAVEQPAEETEEKVADVEPVDPEAPVADVEPEVERPTPSQDLAIGQIVIYRSRTGDYDVPAIVTATTKTLNAKGVELGHIPALSGEDRVHLTCFTAGFPGKRRGAEDFKTESEHPRSENVAGCYQEWDIAPAVPGEEIVPGTWRFPERV